MTTLYELSAAYRALSDRLSDTDMPLDAIADTLDGEAGDLEDKVINTAKVSQNKRAEVKAIREAMADMAKRADSIEKQADHLDNYLLANMQLAGIQKVKSPWFVISLKTSQRTIIDNESLIPADYLREVVEISPNKILIKKSIQEGVKIPGVHFEKFHSIVIK